MGMGQGTFLGGKRGSGGGLAELPGEVSVSGPHDVLAIANPGREGAWDLPFYHLGVWRGHIAAPRRAEEKSTP